MERLRDYVIESNWIEPGTGYRKAVERVVETTLDTAWERASVIATELDAQHGDDHFWSVDVKQPTEEGGGSYVQLFHGRLK